MELEKMLREMIQQAVDERINDAAAVEDRMVRAHGEYVPTAQAAELLDVEPRHRAADAGRRAAYGHRRGKAAGDGASAHGAHGREGQDEEAEIPRFCHYREVSYGETDKG